MPEKNMVVVIHIDPRTGERTPMLIPAHLLARDFGNRCGRCGHTIDESGFCDGCHDHNHNPVPQHLH